jgi:hypothetical protein
VLLSGHLQDRPRYRNISGLQRSAESTNMAEIHCAAIYARFSSDKQSERSIDDQVALCRAFCERDGLRVIGVYEDRAISGASIANRIGWLKLMRDANAGKFDVVVAEALDRISRDQEDLAGIYKRLRSPHFRAAEKFPGYLTACCVLSCRADRGLVSRSEARSLPEFLPVIGGRHQIALIEDISRWTRIILRPFDPYRRNAEWR